MKQFFDTSVLVAAFVADEPHHEACARVVGEAEQGCVFSHGLVECFSILTGSRLGHRVEADLVSRILRENVMDRMEIITLSASETLTTIEGAQAVGVRGGAIYDLLHLNAARKCDADRIFTLNLRHFEAFAPDLQTRLATP